MDLYLLAEKVIINLRDPFYITMALIVLLLWVKSMADYDMQDGIDRIILVLVALFIAMTLFISLASLTMLYIGPHNSSLPLEPNRKI